MQGKRYVIYPLDRLLLDCTHQEATVCLDTAIAANAVPTVRAVADTGEARTHARGVAGGLGGVAHRGAAHAHRGAAHGAHRRDGAGAAEGGSAGVHVTVCASLATQETRAVKAGVAAPGVGRGDGGEGQTVGHWNMDERGATRERKLVIGIEKSGVVDRYLCGITLSHVI